jgi:hypothetical protein
LVHSWVQELVYGKLVNKAIAMISVPLGLVEATHMRKRTERREKAFALLTPRACLVSPYGAAGPPLGGPPALPVRLPKLLDALALISDATSIPRCSSEIVKERLGECVAAGMENGKWKIENWGTMAED